MKEKKTILVAMRKCPQLDTIVDALKSRNYNVLIAGTAKAVMIVLDARHPHLVLTALDLPGQDRPTLIKNLRKFYDASIIALSESSEEGTIVAALDAGANDVLTLPFGRPEHLARIRAALRFGPNSGSIASSGHFSAGGLTIDYGSRSVEVNHQPVHLTPIEFRILTLLTRSAGKVLTHEQIINDVWGPYNSDNLVLRVNMANIRRKIEPNPTEPKYIITEVGVGYRVISE